MIIIGGLSLAVPAIAQEDLPPGWSPVTTTTTTTAPAPVGQSGDGSTPTTALTDLPSGWQQVETPITPFIPAPGSGPAVRCLWQLPDMDWSADGMQYTGPTGAHDDDTNASSTLPCGPGSTGAEARHTIQVRGPADGAVRGVELWAAVDHPDGPDALREATWTITYPDGTLKDRVDGKVLSTHRCAEMATTMFAAAAGSDQVDAVMVNDPNAGMVALCSQEVSAFITASIKVAKSEPCGEYRVDFLTGDSVDRVTQTSFFDVECYVQIELQSDGISFVEQESEDGPRYRTVDPPSVVNLGSGGANIGVLFGEMTPVAEGGLARSGQPIRNFGATLDAVGAAPQSYFAIPAGTIIWFSSDAVLCADEAASVDMWIAEQLLQPGNYSGTVTITARPDVGDGSGGFTCNNDKGVWEAGSQR